jgi:hypothetical protein
MWKHFDEAYIISGGSSDMTVEWILDKWKDISEEIAMNLFCLIMERIAYDCTKRPSMNEKWKLIKIIVVKVIHNVKQ